MKVPSAKPHPTAHQLWRWSATREEPMAIAIAIALLAIVQRDAAHDALALPSPPNNSNATNKMDTANAANVVACALGKFSIPSMMRS